MAGDDDAAGGRENAPAHGDDADEPALAPRVLLTWVELTAVGLTGGVLGASVGGPPGFIVYLAASLLSVGVLLHNVNELVKAWLTARPSG
jgi:hypothetical protein